ncbi:MAG TPA: zinc-binding alcohol dehydrogenase, partial [Vicinamibacterales bacterium]|nr:zinc-binding alcohol dehydrogenase [Vicinamibacterales bacterium]
MTSQPARAFWVTAPGHGAIRDEPLPAASAGEALVQTRYSGISRGTESLVFAGNVPASEHARMRAPFQAGDFPAPVKYGYANVGVVEAGPADVVGRLVFSLFPHQTRFVVPSSALYRLPDAVPAHRGVLAANMETAVNGVWDAAIQPGDRVAVIGAGSVGCLVAWLAGRIPGTEVCLIDVNGARAGVARALGVEFAHPEDAPQERDVVMHVSGAAAGLGLALSLAAFEATVVEMSWFGAQQVTLPLGEAFHAKRLSICSSQVGHVGASHRARWDYRRRMEFAISLLSEPALDVLFTGESAF